MKMNFVFLFLTSLIGSDSQATCDLGKTAHQVVKALAAVEDTKGITASFHLI